MALPTRLPSDVWRKSYSALYQILRRSDSSRNSITIELYSKGVIPEPAYYKIIQLGRAYDADQSTVELLETILTHLKVNNRPAAIDKIIAVLRDDENLKPIVTTLEDDMKICVATTQASLQHPLGITEASPLSVISAEAVSPQSLISTQSPESPQQCTVLPQSLVSAQSPALPQSSVSTHLLVLPQTAAISSQSLVQVSTTETMLRHDVRHDVCSDALDGQRGTCTVYI